MHRLFVSSYRGGQIILRYFIALIIAMFILVLNLYAESDTINTKQTNSPAKTGKKHAGAKEGGSFAMKGELYEEYMPSFGGEASVPKRKQQSLTKGKPIQFLLSPNTKNPKMVDVGGNLPIIITTKGGKTEVKSCTGAPGTQAVIMSGATLGKKQVVKGKLVSTITLDKEGYVIKTFDGSDEGTQILDLESKQLYEYHGPDKFIPVAKIPDQ